MRVTLLGTGSPVPLAERAGTGIHVSTGEERVLIDCGPGTVQRLIENGLHPGAVDRLLFTHHHVDHNADFYQFAIANWTRGEGVLEIHGPSPGTETLVESLHEVYEEDLQYRRRVNDPATDLRDVPVRAVEDGTTFETDGIRLEARAVEHSIETYAYRITDQESGRDVVFSGDTRKIDRLAAFAADADLLIQDCGVAPVGDSPSAPDERLVWEEYTEPLDPEKRDRLRGTHCDPSEAGEIAADAGVGDLVLTHLLPYRDAEAIREEASAAFDGDVVVAEDGLELAIEGTGDVRIVE